MSHSVLGEEHRYGERVASLIRRLFPVTCSHVQASVDSPQSIVVPHLFHRGLAWRTEDSNQEVLENKEVYGDILVRLAFEAEGAFKLNLVAGKRKQLHSLHWSQPRPV